MGENKKTSGLSATLGETRSRTKGSQLANLQFEEWQDFPRGFLTTFTAGALRKGEYPTAQDSGEGSAVTMTGLEQLQDEANTKCRLSFAYCCHIWCRFW